MLQGAEQLVLGLGNDLEGDFLIVTSLAVEVLLNGAQAMVFDNDGLALDLITAVATLVDQHPQAPTAANFREVTNLAQRGDFQRPGQPRQRWQRRQQQGQAAASSFALRKGHYPDPDR